MVPLITCGIFPQICCFIITSEFVLMANISHKSKVYFELKEHQMSHSIHYLYVNVSIITGSILGCGVVLCDVSHLCIK